MLWDRGGNKTCMPAILCMMVSHQWHPCDHVCVSSLITRPYLLFGPELVKHLLDLHTPVVLHAVEGVLGHGGHHCLLDGRQLLQDAGEGRTHVGVLVPALWTHTFQCINTWTHPPAYILYVFFIYFALVVNHCIKLLALFKTKLFTNGITAVLLWQH